MAEQRPLHRVKNYIESKAPPSPPFVFKLGDQKSSKLMTMGGGGVGGSIDSLQFFTQWASEMKRSTTHIHLTHNRFKKKHDYIVSVFQTAGHHNMRGVASSSLNRCSKARSSLNMFSVDRSSLNVCIKARSSLNMCSKARSSLNIFCGARSSLNTCSVARSSLNICSVQPGHHSVNICS